MISGYDCLNKKRFNSRRKVDSEFAVTTSVGSVFQMCIPDSFATAKARLPTVDSLTGGTTKLEEGMSGMIMSGKEAEKEKVFTRKVNRDV